MLAVWGASHRNPRRGGKNWYAGLCIRPKPLWLRFSNVPLPGFGVKKAAISIPRASCGYRFASGHLRAKSFDRQQVQRSAQRAQGGRATHCPEGWSFYKYPGPGFEGLEIASAGIEVTMTCGWISNNRRGLGNDGADVYREP